MVYSIWIQARPVVLAWIPEYLVIRIWRSYYIYWTVFWCTGLHTKICHFHLSSDVHPHFLSIIRKRGYLCSVSSTRGLQGYYLENMTVRWLVIFIWNDYDSVAPEFFTSLFTAPLKSLVATRFKHYVTDISCWYHSFRP